MTMLAEIDSERVKLRGGACAARLSTAAHDPARAACSICDARRTSVCSAIEDRDLARLAAVAVPRDIPRGQIFITEGEPAVDFYNVTHGTVKLYKLLPDGRQQVTGFARGGHFLGLAVSKLYAFSAEALEPVRLCRFTRPKLNQLMDDFPALERRLLETACNELAMAHEQMLLLGRKTARERVASFLLSQSDAGSADRRAAGPIVLPMTRSDIADYLGLTVETISRTLTRFRTEMRIRTLPAGEILILDRLGLEALAAGGG